MKTNAFVKAASSGTRQLAAVVRRSRSGKHIPEEEVFQIFGRDPAHSRWKNGLVPRRSDIANQRAMSEILARNYRKEAMSLAIVSNGNQDRPKAGRQQMQTATKPDNVTALKPAESKRLGTASKVSREKPVHYSPDREMQISHPAWMEAMGTTHADAAEFIAVQFATFAGNVVSEKELDFLTQTVMAVAPKNHVEMMLATQMAIVHQLSMKMAAQAKRANNVPTLEVYHRHTNQLMRTFANQAETLKRYRTGGKQYVKVKHVHVHDGAQAVIGNVDGGGGSGVLTGGASVVFGPWPVSGASCFEERP